jgi:hypothetical protein
MDALKFAAWGLITAGICTACDGAGKPFEHAVVRDSAGISIVTNDVTTALVQARVLGLSPIIIFGAEAPGPALFGAIGGARLHPNGALWIVDSQAREVRVFDAASGAHMFTRGGLGNGPGEFRALRLLGFDVDGAAYIYDDQLGRLTVYSEAGEIVRDEVLTGEGDVSPRPLHVTGSGVVMGQLPRRAVFRPSAVLVQDTIRIWMITSEPNERQLLVTTMGPVWYISDGTQVLVPFSEGALIGFWNDRVYLTDGYGRASLSRHGFNGMELRSDLDITGKALDRESMQQYVEQLRGLGYPARMLQIYENRLPEMPVPKLSPVWDRLVVEDGGKVWLRRRQEPGDAKDVWDILSPSGFYHGKVESRSFIYPVQISAEYVVAVVVDDMGRQTVALYRNPWGADGTQ